MLEQQGAVLEEGTLRGNERVIYLHLSCCWAGAPGASGDEPAARAGSAGTAKPSRGTGRAHAGAPGAGTAPLLPLDYQKVEQGMEAVGNCCRQQVWVPECVAGPWPALLPPHPIPSHPHPRALSQTLVAEWILR